MLIRPPERSLRRLCGEILLLIGERLHDAACAACEKVLEWLR